MPALLTPTAISVLVGYAAVAFALGHRFERAVVRAGAAAQIVAFGLVAKTPENAAFAVVPLILLPFLSSAFVPADKMGPGVRQFAEYQPFTPVIETMRGLLNGTPSAASAITAIAWCIGLTLVGYLWARARFTKRA